MEGGYKDYLGSFFSLPLYSPFPPTPHHHGGLLLVLVFGFERAAARGDGAERPLCLVILF